MKKITPYLGAMSIFWSMSAIAFDLNGVGNDLVADGGIHTTTIPITQSGKVFAVESTPKTIQCQNNLTLDGLAIIGNIADQYGNSTTFLGSGDIVFTLHYQLDGQTWQALNTQTIPCQNGQTVALKASFYRQHHSTTNNSARTHSINKSFALTDKQGTSYPVKLSTTLTFAKPPTTYSCTVNTTEQHIKLNPILISELDRRHRILSSNSANFTLNCNSANATVLAMVYDNLDPSNFGADKTVLSTQHGNGSAKGVGIELYKDGKTLPLGQKTATTPLFFDETYWHIKGSEQRTLTLNAGYVKTGDISSGTVKAQAGLVIFYP